MQKWWSMPVLLAIEVAGILGLFWLLSVFLPGPIMTRAEQKPEIRNYSIQTETGPIQVTDLKRATEFNRILLLPNGRTVVEAGYINS
jgi:hypothetical protein